MRRGRTDSDVRKLRAKRSRLEYSIGLAVLFGCKKLGLRCLRKLGFHDPSEKEIGLVFVCDVGVLIEGFVLIIVIHKDSRNRTHADGFEDRCSTIKLYP